MSRPDCNELPARETGCTKGEWEIQQVVFDKFRFSNDDFQIFPDEVMALTESGTIKLLSILPPKYKAAPAMYKALKEAEQHLIMAGCKPDSYARRNIKQVLAKAERSE